MPLFFSPTQQPDRSRALRRIATGVSVLAICLGASAGPALAATATRPLSPALRAQARRLYAPVRTYEHSTSSAQRVRSRSEGRPVGKMINACQAPYLHRLMSKQRARLDSLWNNATLLQTYEAEVRPVAGQLRTLATSWSALSLRDRAMNEFVHAVAAEFHATLDAAPFDSCSFVKQIAAHHFSYAWASRSSDGTQVDRWWKQISRAGDRTGAFWHYLYPVFGEPEPPDAGAHLFTKHELSVLPSLPGELG